MLAALILAAGRGTRMQSETAKVLHRVGAHSMLALVLQQAYDAGVRDLVVVVGHQLDRVVNEACLWANSVRERADKEGGKESPNLYFAAQHDAG